MFLAEIVIHRPIDVFAGFRRESEHLVFEAIGRFNLIGSIHNPVIHAEAVTERKTGAHTHVIEGQKVEPECAGIADLIFGVVPLDSKRTSPLAKVNAQSSTNRGDVAAVCLKYIPIDLWSRFVGRIPLERLRRLTELQVQTSSPSMPRGDVWRVFRNDGRLIQTELVTRHVVCPQQIDSTDGIVEVVSVIRVQSQVDGRVAQEIEVLAIRRANAGD